MLDDSAQAQKPLEIVIVAIQDVQVSFCSLFLHCIVQLARWSDKVSTEDIDVFATFVLHLQKEWPGLKITVCRIAPINPLAEHDSLLFYVDFEASQPTNQIELCKALRNAIQVATQVANSHKLEAVGP